MYNVAAGITVYSVASSSNDYQGVVTCILRLPDDS